MIYSFKLDWSLCTYHSCFDEWLYFVIDIKTRFVAITGSIYNLHYREDAYMTLCGRARRIDLAHPR